MSGEKEALIVVDMQCGFDDVRWGVRNNPDAETRGLRVLRQWRRLGRQVVVVRHDSTSPASPLRPGSDGNAFKAGFEPQPGDWLIGKQVHSAFIGTDLEARLRSAGIKSITIFGITTDQCVSTTTRMASNLGFAVTLVEDACACFGQTAPDGGTVGADQIHLAHITTLRTEFAHVTTTDAIIRSLETMPCVLSAPAP